MSSTTIEQLEVEIKSSSTSAVSGIEALAKSLNTLKSATKGGVGLTSISSQLKTIDSTLKSMSGNSNKITTLANSLEKLRNVSNIKISSSLANQLKAINQVASSIKGSSYSGITQLSNALGKLQNIGSLKVPSKLGDKLTSLSQSAATLNGQDYSGIRNLASALSQLNGIDLSKLNSTVSNLSTSLKGLNSNMNQTSSSTEDFGETLSDVEDDAEEATEKNKKLVITWSDIANKIKSAISIIQKVASVLGSVIGQSNDYIEDMNFAVSSLGSNFADAQAYAEDLTEKLGIDSAEFLKYEGTFDTIIEGFGVASDKAYRMSKQLTELGYDISSYANIDVSEAMTKLQSGISGELEPLRRLGYDLSDARLAQDALTLGITKSTSAMTQAEKSQLRYYEILTQVTVAQGDMARTINAPANQLRVFRAQVTMCVRAIGNLFIPILNKVLPVGIAFVKVLRKMAEALAGFLGIELSTVDDSAWESASNAASSLADTTSDIADTASDVADSSSSLTPSYTSAAQAAKKLKNNLLGIDELNVLSQDDDDSLSDSLSDLGNTGLGDTGLGNTGLSDDAFDIPIPEYDFASSVSDYLSDTINDIEGKISKFMAFLAGALLVLGVILLYFGQVPLGISCIVAGIAIAAAVIGGTDIDRKIKEILLGVMVVVGACLVALGVMMIMFGQIPLGVGMIIAGAATLASAAAIYKYGLGGEISKEIQGALIMGGVAMITIGVLLMCFGQFVWGIGFIIAGAATVVSAVALNPGQALATIKEFFGGSQGLFAAGLVLAMLGIIILVFSAGTFLPLGIALLVAGIAGIVTAVVTDKGLQKDIKKFFNSLKKWVIKHAFLILGVILCVTGVGLGLGLGLIVAGLAAIATDKVINSETIKKKVKNVINSIKKWIKKHEFVLGVILCATGVGIPIGVRLIKDYYSNQKSSDSSKESLLSKIKKAFKGVDKEGETAGKNLAKGVKKGYDDNIKAESFGSKLLSGIKSFFGIHSPSTVMRDEVGTYLGSGLLEGINSGTGDISSWLSENVLDPLKEGINNNPLPDIALKIGTKAKDLWSGFKEKWDGVKSSVSAKVKLVKNKWKSVASWAKEHIGGKVSKGIDLAKNKWDSVASWVKEHAGKTVSHGVKLTKSGWSKVSSWIYKYPGSVVKHGVGLIKSGWSRVKSWVDQFQGDSVKKDVSLTKYWYTVSDWVSGFIGGAVSVAVNLTKGWAGSIGSFLGFSGGGIIGANGSIQMFANGGVINWNSIPKYANGTNKPHGSMFVAGESGAELVGHVNGQTEVMNRFQLASVMKESIVSGMTQFANYWQSMSRDMVTCANGVINAVMVSGDEMNNSIAMANESSVYNPYTEGVAYNMQSETGKGSTPDDKWMDNMRTFYTNYVEPTMKAIASDVKTQADKSEKTVVQMNGKTLLSAIEKQKKANGHSFIK